jgi:hypothetical protein
MENEDAKSARILGSFNTSVLDYVRVLSVSFPDSAASAAYKNFSELLAENRETTKLNALVCEGLTTELTNSIFMEKKECIHTTLFFKVIGIDVLFDKFVDEEKAAFWKWSKLVLKYSSLINACGKSIDSIQDIAAEWSAKNADVPAEQRQAKIMAELLSGGDFSQRMMKTLMNPDSIKCMLKNVGTLMRSSDGNPSPMEEILKEVTQEDIESCVGMKDLSLGL